MRPFTIHVLPAMLVIHALTLAAPAAEPISLRGDLSLAPGVVIDHWPASSGMYVGSPSVVILPDGVYVASHDLFGPKSTYKTSAVTRVFRSLDRGETWSSGIDLDGQLWSTLFTRGDELFLLGTRKRYGPIILRRSTDGGQTWSEPRDENSGLLGEGPFHCAPQPVVFHKGRIWRAMEDNRGSGGWAKHFRAMMISAPDDADLLKAANWTFSNPLGGDPSWLGGQFNGWLEGNVVVTPEGQIVNILRVDVPSGGKAAMIRVSDDGREARFDPGGGFLDFPGGCKKFTIRFDDQTRRYWALVNYVPPRHAEPHAGGTRNTLALTCSSDLVDWEVRCILLYHPDRQRHGFQYPDWVFDGDDLVAAVRTAYDDGLGGAHNAHDANFLTFHRFEDFRGLTLADSVIDPVELGCSF